MKEVGKKTIEEPERCNVCDTIFENSLRSQHRKLIDQCGHAICFSCLINSAMCTICKIDEAKETDFVEEIVEAPLDQSPIINKRPSLKNDEIEIRPLCTKNSEKLFKLGEEISKKLSTGNKESKVVCNESVDFVCLDSEDEFIVKEGLDGTLEVIDNETKPKSSMPVKEKCVNYENVEDDDDDDDIESIDLNIVSNEIEEVSSGFVKHKDICIPSLDSYEKIKWLFSDVKVNN